MRRRLEGEPDGIKARYSPDPIWFPPSSPPAPSVASSRSCGWRLMHGGLSWAAGAGCRAGAGAEVEVVVPWRSRNAHFNLQVVFFFKLCCLNKTVEHQGLS